MEILILGTKCPVTQKYLELVECKMKEIRIYGLVLASMDPKVHRQYKVENRCMPQYCLGCEFKLPSQDICLPALVINGEVVAHSQVPTEQEIDKLLRKGLQ